MRRLLQWRIDDTALSYEVYRFSEGTVTRVALCDTREEAWTAYELDRAKELADPNAIEVRSLEYRMT